MVVVQSKPDKLGIKSLRFRVECFIDISYDLLLKE